VFDGLDCAGVLCGFLLALPGAAGPSGLACANVPAIQAAADTAEQQRLGRLVWAGIKSVRREIVKPARTQSVTLLRKVFGRR